VSKIEIGRYSEQLRRMLGMKGVQEVSGELSPEITATLELEGPTDEWAFLKQLRLAGVGTRVTAGAVNVSTVRLRNPAASGCIAVIEEILFGTQVTQILRIQLGQAAVEIGGVLLTGVRDSRWEASGAAGQNSLILSSTNSGGAVVGRVMQMTHVLANAPLVVPIKFVLLPGDNLDLTGLSNNIEITVSLGWTERALPSLEA